MKKYSNPLKCLVTGGAGFIGSHLSEALLKDGHTVRVLDNFSTGKRENLLAVLDNIEVLEGDICDLAMAQKACEGIDAIFHQAALTSVFASIQEPLETLNVNTGGLLNILEAARQNHVKTVIFASSAAIYGQHTEVPKREDMAADPVSPYGLSKMTGEQYCELYSRLYGINTVCLRYFNVYGPRQLPESQYSGVISVFTRTVLSGKNPVVYGDGLQSRDFVYVEDIIQANLLALQAPQTGEYYVYNVANGKPYNLLQVLDILKETTHQNFEIEYRPERRGDLRNSYADITKAGEIMGFVPTKSFEQGLTEYIEFMQNQHQPNLI